MDISIRAADEDEALSVLNDPSVKKLLKFYPVGIQPEWAILMIEEKILLLANEVDNDLEIHIACRYRDRVNTRQIMRSSLDWLARRGYRNIWTTAPESRKGLVKLLESLQFRKVGERWVYGY